MSLSQKFQDEQFMRMCLNLARKGLGHVSPNPLVGAIIVKNEKIIGKGYHKKFGGPHAEVNAIQYAKGSVNGATLYVNLEPCNYYGKTPACTDLIIKSKIARVVIGMKDPNPRVSGKGILQLQKADIATSVGILKKECWECNKFFSKHITTGLPYTTLKIAQSLDGKIVSNSLDSQWITNSESRRLVHQLRSQYDAVLVGANTIQQDNPRLTVRSVKGRNPIRVVLDGRFTCDIKAKVFSKKNSTKSIILISQKFSKLKSSKRKYFIDDGVNVLELQGSSDGIIPIKNILKKLGEIGITSLLVEGGASIFSAFVNELTVDKIIMFIAPKILGPGLEAYRSVLNSRKLKIKKMNVSSLYGDVLITADLS